MTSTGSATTAQHARAWRIALHDPGRAELIQWSVNADGAVTFEDVPWGYSIAIEIYDGGTGAEVHWPTLEPPDAG